MNRFKARKVDDSHIVLEKAEDIGRLYQVISNGEDFILSWVEGEVEKSRLIVASDLTSKIRNKEIEISAEERKEVEKDD